MIRLDKNGELVARCQSHRIARRDGHRDVDLPVRRSGDSRALDGQPGIGRSQRHVITQRVAIGIRESCSSLGRVIGEDLSDLGGLIEIGVGDHGCRIGVLTAAGAATCAGRGRSATSAATSRQHNDTRNDDTSQFQPLGRLTLRLREHLLAPVPPPRLGFPSQTGTRRQSKLRREKVRFLAKKNGRSVERPSKRLKSRHQIGIRRIS